MKLRRVIFVSQRRAEQMKPPKDAAIISITDPSLPAAQLRGGWAAVLRVCFVDADPVTFQDEGDAPGSISEDEVAEIAAFAARQASSCRLLVVHCRHGVSRSAAVARAICQAAQLPFPAGYEKYNRYVFLVLRGALQYAFDEA
jgi:predicted protein tyrosine phosphatase